MTRYEKPEIEIIKIAVDDVIMASEMSSEKLIDVVNNKNAQELGSVNGANLFTQGN